LAGPQINQVDVVAGRASQQPIDFPLPFECRTLSAHPDAQLCIGAVKSEWGCHDEVPTAEDPFLICRANWAFGSKTKVRQLPLPLKKGGSLALIGTEGGLKSCTDGPSLVGKAQSIGSDAHGTNAKAVGGMIGRSQEVHR
jgi:hypothetical protein